MVHPPAPRRTILDVSSIVRWAGSATGILRVEQALARYARASRSDIVLALFDPQALAFRRIAENWADALIGWETAIDAVTFDDRRHRTLFRRLANPRYPLLMALERWRIQIRVPAFRHAVDSLQRAICAGRDLPDVFIDRTGRRLSRVPADMALGNILTLGPEDTVITVGYDWGNQRPDRILPLKARDGFRLVTLCYDLIALNFPQYLPARGVVAFSRYWASMFAGSDRILVLSHHVADDIRRYCTGNGIKPAEIRMVRPGFDLPQAQNSSSLPDGLEAGRYVLYVSTIEPRKGHDMLLGVWERLLAAGVPQRHRFKLVFAGRVGWQVEALTSRIGSHPALGQSLVHVTEVDDAGLTGLYAGAAFCAFPSRYEGFGLPVIEAFAHGKAIIASAAGALPEVVDRLSPCLDPNDSDAWHAILRGWIEDPAARQVCERKIRASFGWPNWTEAAAQMLTAAES